MINKALDLQTWATIGVIETILILLAIAAYCIRRTYKASQEDYLQWLEVQRERQEQQDTELTDAVLEAVRKAVREALTQ